MLLILMSGGHPQPPGPPRRAAGWGRANIPAMRMLRLIALLSGAMAAPLATLFAQAADPHLIPRPRELTPGTYVTMPRVVTIAVGQSDADRFAADELAPLHSVLARVSSLRTTSSRPMSTSISKMPGLTMPPVMAMRAA